MKMLKLRFSRRIIGLLLVVSLILTGCTSATPCRGCDRAATKHYKNVNNSENVYHFCEKCAPKCMYCFGNANKWLTAKGTIYICDSCYSRYY